MVADDIGFTIFTALFDLMHYFTNDLFSVEHHIFYEMETDYVNLEESTVEQYIKANKNCRKLILL